MKPLSEWTEEEKNHFFTLLIGKCWHDFTGNEGVCHHCKKSYSSIRHIIVIKDYPLANKYDSNCNYNFYADLSGFQRIKDFMEKEMPEVWEKYVAHYMITYTDYPNDLPDDVEETIFTRMLDKTLSLDNLLAFLLENKEMWGWEECIDLEVGHDLGKEICNNWTEYCGHCDELGKIKHPALIYAEGL